jgi:DNA recombination protein RmuC
MTIIICILLTIVTFAAGYAFGTMRSQREAVAAKAELAASRKHADEALRAQAAALRAEFKAVSAETMRSQGDALRESHLHSLEALLQPLGRDIDRFRTQFVSGHASLDSYIKSLIAQTQTLGRDAENLAKALKGNNKLQGNWGEAVLDNLLATSGLTEGRDYTLQSHLPDGMGSTAIPDVVVHLPGERNVIIDSKVSLKHYTAYVATDDPAEQAQLLKEHVRSVRQHIKELSAKNYNKLVPNSIGYVLMFIPGEGAYMAAVNAEPTLSAEAYAQHVILINPTNLLMALQLAYNLWQSEMQSRSVHEIYTSAEKLYKKFTTFAQNFVKIGNGMQQLQRTYDEAYKQLCTGRGNIVSQLEGWKKKGLTPTSSLPDELTAQAELSDDAPIDLLTDAAPSHSAND